MKYCPLCGKNYGDEIELCELDGAILRTSGKKDPYLGSLIKGRYQVLSKLGEGGMGTVYLAEQVSVGRKVAIKFLLGNYATDDGFISRFRREARLAASLNHRNIVILYDFDQANDGTLFIVMEYLSGQKLSDVIRRDGSLEVSRATRLGLQIADGLDAAHRAGVIHIDIKPDNIMVAGTDSAEEIKLMDFGIARLRDTANASQITRAGLIVGTPAYMAPEQVEGAEVSDKTDIYALGVVLYEMLSGNVPFTAATPGAVLIKQMQEMPVPLRKLRRELPAAVERVVMQALEKQPRKRQSNMSEVVQQLRKAEEEFRGKAPKKHKEPASAWNRIRQPVRKSDEQQATAFEPIPEEIPPQRDNPRTVLEEAGPQWAPTRVLKPEVHLKKAGGSKHRIAIALVILLSLGAFGSYFYFQTIRPSASTALTTNTPLTSSQTSSNETVTSTEPYIPNPTPQVVSVSVTSEKSNLTPKEVTSLRVIGKLSDGSEKEIPRGFKWRSSNESVVSVNPEGQAEAQGEGTAELRAEYENQISPPLKLVVKTDRQKRAAEAPTPLAPPRSLIVLSAKRELQPNERIVLKVKGQYSDGREVDVHDGIQWQSSDERIVSIDARGRVTAHRSGNVKVDATFEGVRSPAISLVVKDLTPEPQPPIEVPQKPQSAKPKAPDTRENLRSATVFYEEGKYSEALIEIEQALRLDPENRDARVLRAKVMKAWEAEKRLSVKTP